MANQGDLSLARQLQAEFSKAKEPRRKGRRAGGTGRDNFQAPLERQYQPLPLELGRQRGRATSNRGSIRNRCRREASSTALHPRPAWQGKLVTNDSPGNNKTNLQTAEADSFFHNDRRPLPSESPPPPPTISQVTPPVLNAQQPDGQQSTLNSVPYFSNPPNNNVTGTFGMPLDQRTNRALPKVPPSTTLSAPTTTLQRGGVSYAQQTQEQEDVEMGDADCRLTPALKPNPPKGLSGSMWNPANENTRADPVNSREVQNLPGNPKPEYSYLTNVSIQASLKPRSNTSSSTKEVEIVTSGLTKGPGLKASR